jgi:hypothetical protein
VNEVCGKMGRWTDGAKGEELKFEVCLLGGQVTCVIWKIEGDGVEVGEQTVERRESR